MTKGTLPRCYSRIATVTARPTAVLLQGTSMRRMESRAWCIRIPGCRILGSLTARSAAQQPSPVMLASGCRARPSLNPSTIVVSGCLRQPCMQSPAHGWIFYVHKRRCQLASYLLLSSQSHNLLGIASRRQVWRGKRWLCHANSFVSFFLFIITFNFFNASFGIWWLVNIY